MNINTILNSLSEINVPDPEGVDITFSFMKIGFLYRNNRWNFNNLTLSISMNTLITYKTIFEQEKAQFFLDNLKDNDEKSWTQIRRLWEKLSPETVD